MTKTKQKPMNEYKEVVSIEKRDFGEIKLIEKDPVKGERYSVINSKTGDVLEERINGYLSELPKDSKWGLSKKIPIQIDLISPNFYSASAANSLGLTWEGTGDTPEEAGDYLRAGISDQMDTFQENRSNLIGYAESCAEQLEKYLVLKKN